MLDRLARQLRPEAVSLTALGLLMLGIAAAYLYVLKQPLSEYRGLLRHQAGASVGLRTGREEPAAVALAGLRQEVEELQQRLYGGPSSVPLREMESYVIQTLDRISVRHGVELVGVRPLAIGEVLMFDELPYDVEVTGSYMRLWDWLQDMEAELRPMVVNSYELERRSDATPVGMKLRLVAYRAREHRE